jgi:hypothetical protein
MIRRFRKFTQIVFLSCFLDCIYIIKRIFEKIKKFWKILKIPFVIFFFQIKIYEIILDIENFEL